LLGALSECGSNSNHTASTARFVRNHTITSKVAGRVHKFLNRTDEAFLGRPLSVSEASS
jgi:hypothetical protein